MDARERQLALDHARQGDTQARSDLLESFRPYVRVIARAFRVNRVQARIDESDLIQDALLEAHQSFADFRGTTVGEFTAWLRQIVLHTAGRTIRDHLATGKRAVGREQPVGSDAFAGLTAGSSSSPSAQAIRHEEADRMAEGLARLPDEMREVLLARHMDGLGHAAIAKRMGKTEAAVRMLYTRAVRRLRELCAE
ncbi:MAG: sigma-70 family RNA polymerase sigma factor [Planctomycetes bacterium]|nr:sigma-70 family RNA polymerase sigma factor [Planctomycetota bacterium]